MLQKFAQYFGLQDKLPRGLREINVKKNLFNRSGTSNRFAMYFYGL